MPTFRVVLFDQSKDPAPRMKALAAAGFDAVHCSTADGAAGLRHLREDPPDAFAIDQERLPSHGRAIAVSLRQQKATRHVPIIFLGGAQEKLALARDQLPDAVFAEWAAAGPAIRRAIRTMPAQPVVPGTMAGYSGTPLPKKLGIKPDTVVLLLDAPAAFEETLAAKAGDPALLAGVTFRRQPRGRAALVMLFADSQAHLNKRLPAAMRAMAPGGSIWVAWPKKSSGVASDLSDGIVRQTGLDAGLVDFKVCAIDETWAGYRFSRRAKAK